MKPVNLWIERLDLELARDAVGLATAADDVQTVVASSSVTATQMLPNPANFPFRWATTWHFTL